MQAAKPRPPECRRKGVTRDTPILCHNVRPPRRAKALAHEPLTPAETTRTASWVEPPEEELGLKRYLETIRERWVLVAVSTLVCLAVAVLYVLVAQKTYKAEADMLITPVDPSTLPSLPLIRQSADPTRDVETASKLVTNVDVAARVKNQLHLSESPQDLLKEVTAEPVASSNIVAVTAEQNSKAEARALANAFANQAVAEQTDKLHREIASQFQGLKASLTAPAASTDAGTLAELQALSTGPDPSMRVETLADLPQEPASPKPFLTITGGLIAGLVLGIVAAFAAQILDPRLRREEQLRRRYRLPILARIPKEDSRRDMPLGPRNLSAAAAEAYRTLRATISRVHAHRDEGGAGDPRHRPVRQRGQEHDGGQSGLVARADRTGRDPDRGGPPPALARHPFST